MLRIQLAKIVSSNNTSDCQVDIHYPSSMASAVSSPTLATFHSASQVLSFTVSFIVVVVVFLRQAFRSV